MAYNPKSKENLKKIRKGEVKNPKGRGKGTLNSKTIIEKWLSVKRKTADPFSKPLTPEEKAKGKKPKAILLSEYDLLVIAQIGKARKGDTWAFNSLIDRIEGRPKQPSELLGADGEPVNPNDTIIIEL